MPCWIAPLPRAPLVSALRAAAAALLLAACVLLAYLEAPRGPFQFDDWNVIADNPAVHDWVAWWHSMPGIRGLLKASYVANWRSGLGVAGFHWVNIALHLANSLLVLVVVRQILLRCGLPRPRLDTAAFSAALVFALHPAQTEAVTYISGRSVSLMALFLLLAMWLHLRAADSRRGQVLVCTCFVLAFAVKETAWCLPLAVLAIEIASNEPRLALRRTLPQWITLAALALLGLMTPGYRRLLEGSLALRSSADNLRAQIDGVSYLLTQPLLQLHTNIDPQLSLPESWTTSLLLKAAALALLPALAWWQWRRRPWLALGLLWPFIFLLPTNSFLPRQDLANDRQLYLALIGPAWLLGALLAGWRPLALRVVAVGVLSGVLGLVTIARNADYRSERALWEASARDSPTKARVWNNLGYAREQAGDHDGALAAYRRALQLEPGHVKARGNLLRLESVLR